RDLTATLNLQGGRFTLEWLAPLDTGGGEIIGYRIQRNTDDQGWVTITDTMHAGTSQVDASAELGQEHSYRVAAITNLGVTHHSPYSAATPARKAMRVPGTPAAPTAAPAPGSPTQPLVKWIAPHDGGAPITTYTLERDDGAGWREHRSEEHTSELQSRENLVCRLLLEKK